MPSRTDNQTATWSANSFTSIEKPLHSALSKKRQLLPPAFLLCTPEGPGLSVVVASSRSASQSLRVVATFFKFLAPSGSFIHKTTVLLPYTVSVGIEQYLQDLMGSVLGRRTFIDWHTKGFL